MITAVGPNLSALGAFEKKMGVISNNIANLDSQGFKKSRAVMVEGQNNSVEVEVSQIESPGPTMNEGTEGKIKEIEYSNVELTEEIPQTIIALRGYEANYKGHWDPGRDVRFHPGHYRLIISSPIP